MNGRNFMKSKDVGGGCGCGCLLWILIICAIIGGVGSCIDNEKLKDIKGSDKVIASAESCSFGPFTKEFYRMALKDEKTVFETSLEGKRFEWCGTLLDAKQKGDKYYFFVTAYKRHFTGQPWDVFKVQHKNRLPYVVRVESDLADSIDLDKINMFNKGDYISFNGILRERGGNESSDKRYWEMDDAKDFTLKKADKKKRQTTYYKETLKRERQEMKDAEERAKTNNFNYSDNEVDESELSPIKYKNCDELREDYPDGVSKDHAAYNPNLDGDKDGHACGE